MRVLLHSPIQTIVFMGVYWLIALACVAGLYLFFRRMDEKPRRIKLSIIITLLQCGLALTSFILTANNPIDDISCLTGYFGMFAQMAFCVVEAVLLGSLAVSKLRGTLAISWKAYMSYTALRVFTILMIAPVNFYMALACTV